jgi:hypothetical protein
VKTVKLLALVTKDTLPVYVEQMRTDLTRALTAFGLPNAALTDSGAWFHERFAVCGDWESWIWETVNGKDYATRQPNFDGFVVCTDTLGRANAQIIDLALRNDRAVLAWDGSELRSVSRLVTHDSNRWVDGWGIETTSLGGSP